MGWLRMVNWKACGHGQEGMKKTTKTPFKIPEIRTLDLPNEEQNGIPSNG
jgi:hypothetical protein